MFKAYINWSSGKDAAFALYLLQQGKTFSVEKLITTINSEDNRISMHGLRKDLLVRQAESIGIPLHLIHLSGNVPLIDYNAIMAKEIFKLKDSGYTYSIFGDIFLQDLRKYREQQLEKMKIKAVFPLWKRDTTGLMQDFLSAGFKAITLSVNAKLLDKSFCGRTVDEQFLKELPPGVDPCGENGEFHTFVFDGPNFKDPINFRIGEIIERKYTSTKKNEDGITKGDKTWDTNFHYCDLLPT